MEHFIDVISYDDDTTVKTLGPYNSSQLAEKAESGLNRQLDHSRFYSQLRSE